MEQFLARIKETDAALEAAHEAEIERVQAARPAEPLAAACLSPGLALAQLGLHFRFADHPRLVIVADLHQAATDPGRHAPGAGRA